MSIQAIHQMAVQAKHENWDREELQGPFTCDCCGLKYMKGAKFTHKKSGQVKKLGMRCVLSFYGWNAVKESEQ